MAAVRGPEPANARHFLPNRWVAIHPDGMEFHAHRPRVEVIDEQLNLERVMPPVGLDLHGKRSAAHRCSTM
jgi:hypothetical protein